MTDQKKIIYDILCSDEQPPEGQHWEGFVASKIAAALAQPEPVIYARKEGDLIVVDLPQVATGGGGVSKEQEPNEN